MDNTKLTEPKSGVCVEIGSLLFGISSVVVSGLVTAVCSVWLFYIAAKLLSDDRPIFDFDKIIIAISVASVLLSAIAFAFSMILLKGLSQERPGYVKAYIVFGVVVLVTTFAASVVKMVLSATSPYYKESNFFVMGISEMAACLIYSAILSMIWARYKMLQEVDQYDRTALLATIYGGSLLSKIYADTAKSFQ